MTMAEPAAIGRLDPASGDRLLAQCAGAGDGRAFALIMRRYNRLLYRTARSILRSDADAEDALQEAYLRAWGAIDGFRSEAKLSTWLTRIVINESLARLRRRRTAPATSIDPTGEPERDPIEDRIEDDPDQQPDRLAMRGELRHLMEAGIDDLPDAFRTVFILRAVEEMSVEDVALALDLPQATVRTRMFRARGQLRERLAREIDVVSPDAFAFDGARCDRVVANVVRRAGFTGNAARRCAI